MSRDPTGRRALFSAGAAPGARAGGSPARPAAPRPAPSGRGEGGKRALFSAADPRVGPLRVVCGGCGVTTRVGWLELGRRRLPLPLWLPWRRHPYLLTCPACGERHWAAVGFAR